MSKFLLSLLCSQSGIVSSASWGSHCLGEADLSTSKALSLPAFPSRSLSILRTPPLLPRHLCPSRKGWSSSLTKAPARCLGPGELPGAGQNFPRSKLAQVIPSYCKPFQGQTHTLQKPV